MVSYFLDTSAIVKRYIREAGSNWFNVQSDFADESPIFICEITLAETAAALAAKQRASDGITEQQRDSALDLFLKHGVDEYSLIAVNREIINQAVVLTQTHKLRGCDSIQLAAALLVNKTLTSAEFAPLTFVAADSDLLQAADVAGLQGINPAGAKMPPSN